MRRRHQEYSIVSTIAAITLTVTLSACGGGGGGGGDTTSGDGTSTVSGTGQKGPFQPGGTATATRLAADGTETTDQVSGDIDTDGNYELPELSWTGATALAVEGTYFDEVNGNFTSATRRLEAVILADGTLQANVNLFTHILAERARTLMNEGDSAADALSQGRSEIQSLLGISTTPSELNLLEAAANPDEADGASLLLFAAAVEQAGLSQAQLDAMAADFGDDGQMNGSVDGTGEAAFQSVQQAAEDDTLLNTARTNLENQYAKTPPEVGSGGGIGWELDACTAAKLSQPRVFCGSDSYHGTLGNDDGEPILYFPPEDGYYAFALNDPADKLSFGGWTLHNGEDFTGAEVGDSSADSTSPYESVTTFDLDAGDPYAVRVNLNGLDLSTDEFTLIPHQVSEGGGYFPVEIAVGEPHDGRVAQYFASGTTTGGPATSWYRFTPGGGNYTITATYAADSGSGGLRLRVYQGDADQEGVNDLNSLTDLDVGYEDGTDTTEVQVNAEAGKTVFVLVTNQFTDFKRSSSIANTGWVEFNLTVTEQ